MASVLATTPLEQGYETHDANLAAFIQRFGARGQALSDAATYFSTTRSHAHRVRVAVRALVAGQRVPKDVPDAGPHARALLGALKQTKPDAPTLYRGVRLPGTSAEVKRQLAPGATVTLSLSSFTPKTTAHADFWSESLEPHGPRSTRVRYEVVSGSRALALAPAVRYYHTQRYQEWVSGGTYRVLSTTRERSKSGQSILRVRLEQLNLDSVTLPVRRRTKKSA